MKKTARSAALVGGVVLSLACAMLTHAQQRDPNQPRPTPNPTPYQRNTATKGVITPRDRPTNQGPVGTQSDPDHKVGKLPQPDTGSGQQLVEIRCRGGGLQISSVPGEMHQSDLYMNITVHFERANYGAGLSGESLAPGQCALPDRPFSVFEPKEMRAEVINFGQRNRKMHGDPIYVGDPGAEKYPDAQNIPPYLENANHYWSFFGVNTNDGYFRITDSHYWKPSSEPIGTGHLEQTPEGGGSHSPLDRPAHTDTQGGGSHSPLDVPVHSVTRHNPDPVPDNAVRITISYRKELGYFGTQTAFGNVGPYSCDAFTVDARIGGLGGYKGVGNSIVNPARMKDDGHYYICSFTITGLPLNQQVMITAAVDNEARFLTGPWQGAGQPRPPDGSQRTVIDGAKNVLLTNRNPSAVVAFSMDYLPISTPVR